MNERVIIVQQNTYRVSLEDYESAVAISQGWDYDATVIFIVYIKEKYEADVYDIPVIAI